MLNTLTRRLAVVLALAVVAACDDDDPTNPTNSVNFDGIITNCVEGEIDVSAGTAQVETGTVNDDDCFNIEQERGFVEAWELPQTGFGDATSLDIELQADFDGVILILNQDGEFVDLADEDLGGDFGHEMYTLDFDADVDEPTYFVVVFSYEGEEAGAYTLTVTPVEPAI